LKATERIGSQSNAAHQGCAERRPLEMGNSLETQKLQAELPRAVHGEEEKERLAGIALVAAKPEEEQGECQAR
jgi:hypothetical protein